MSNKLLKGGISNYIYQQSAKKLKPYVIYIPVTISQEELEKMLNKKRI